MKEEKLIQEIIDIYAEVARDIYDGTLIPRNKAITEFTTVELETLRLLMNDRVTLSLDFEFFDKVSNIFFKLENDSMIKTILHQPQNYEIKTITFNYAYGMIWITLYFADQIDHLLNEITVPETINPKDIFFALVVAVMCFVTFFMTYGGIPEILGFTLSGAGSLAACFIYEKLKNHLSSKNKNKITEQKFYISHYLTNYLAEYANQKLNLDIDEKI